MKWLTDTLRQFSTLNLDHPDGCRIMAEAILAAIPKDVVQGSVMSAAGAVLKVRNIADGAGDLAREIGNNAAATTLMMLAIADDDAPLAEQLGGEG